MTQVTLTFDADIYRLFKGACILRKTSPTAVLRQSVLDTLQDWGMLPEAPQAPETHPSPSEKGA